MYIAMEFCEYGDLFDIIYKTGALSEHASRFYFRQILSGLQAVHEAGFCHRDMKPANLLFDANYSLKIGDFGFSNVLKGT
jgi:serine/threonine protein kinase